MKSLTFAAYVALVLCAGLDRISASTSGNVKGAQRDVDGLGTPRTLRGHSSYSRSKGPKIFKMSQASTKMSKMGKMTKTKKGKKSTAGSLSSSKSGKKGSEESTDIEEVISLGNRRPEGVASGPGPTIFVTTFLWGGVIGVNVLTNEVEQVVPDTESIVQRLHVGIKYYNGALFVAGGGPAQGVDGNLYVYDATTGDEIVTCAPDFDARFLNDLTISNGNAYVTDSQVNKIMVVDVDAALAGECVVSSLDTPEMFMDTTGTGFFQNGIAGYGDGFLFVDGGRGGIYYFDLDDNSVINVVSPEIAPAGDGMIIQGGKLYVTENFFDRISVWTLDGLNIELEGYITSPYFDTPTTSAIYGGYIFSCNARFLSLPAPAPNEADPSIFTETFDLVRAEI